MTPGPAPDPRVSVAFDPRLTAEDVELFLLYLSQVYRELGGVGLTVVGIDPRPAAPPAPAP